MIKDCYKCKDRQKPKETTQIVIKIHAESDEQYLQDLDHSGSS